MATNTPIEDFGEKIGGARKDLAAMGSKLSGKDISSWTAEERQHYVTRDILFKKPDYKSLVDNGMPREIAYFIKTLYDSLPKRPAKPTEESQRAYVDFIRYFREKIENIYYTEQARNFCTNFVINSPYVELAPPQHGYGRAQYSNTTECITAVDFDEFRKFFRAAQFNESVLRNKVQKNQFCYSKEEKLTAEYRFRRYDGNNFAIKDDPYSGRERLVYTCGSSSEFYNVNGEMADPKFWEAATWVAINSKRDVVGINYTSKEAAIKDIAEQVEKAKKETPDTEKKPLNRKTSFIPKQLEHIQRVGQDFRDGNDITGEDMMQTFGFRGGEFGNWENQNDRQANLNMAFEAFKDLAKALDISDEDISLGGKLAMAWGARGHGNALAHYESASNVINLTKLKGAGSLAHEWGHALDSFMQKMTNNGAAGMATDNSRLSSNITHRIMDSILYNFNEETNTMSQTEFYKNALALDKVHSSSGNQNGGYWHSNKELFARAFATYIMDKLKPEGKNDYLCGHAEMASTNSESKPIYAYPRGEERIRINKEFDKLIEELKERGYIHTRNDIDNQRIVHEEYKDDKIETIVDESERVEAAEPKAEVIYLKEEDFYQPTLFEIEAEQKREEWKKAAQKGLV